MQQPKSAGKKYQFPDKIDSICVCVCVSVGNALFGNTCVIRLQNVAILLQTMRRTYTRLHKQTVTHMSCVFGTSKILADYPFCQFSDKTIDIKWGYLLCYIFRLRVLLRILSVCSIAFRFSRISLWSVLFVIETFLSFADVWIGLFPLSRAVTVRKQKVLKCSFVDALT